MNNARCLHHQLSSYAPSEVESSTIEDGHCKGSGGFPSAMTLRLEPRVWDSRNLALYSSRLGNWLSYQGARWRCTSAACVAKLDLGQKGESDFAGFQIERIRKRGSSTQVHMRQARRSATMTSRCGGVMRVSRYSELPRRRRDLQMRLAFVALGKVRRVLSQSSRLCKKAAQEQSRK